MIHLYSLILSASFQVADAFLIVGIVLLLLFSAFFSASETAYTSSNNLRIKNYADDKKPGARRAVYIIENYNKTLNTILVGNNLVNIASTTLCAYLFGKFIVNPTLANVLNMVVMTLIVLIFGEIVPKMTAKSNPEKVAMRFSGVMFFFVKVLTPITWLFSGLQKILSKKNNNIEPTVTEDELESIIDTMQSEGVIDADNAEIMQSALDLRDVTVKDIMTPRVDMIAVDITATKKEVDEIFLEHQFSRMPVYENDKDNIVGVLNGKDYFSALLKGEDFDINKFISEPMFVIETMKADDLVKEMRSKKKMLAIVIDEFGGTSGIVTLEDAIEELVGEIYDETDDIELEEFIPLGDNKYSISPEMSVEDLFDELEIEHIPADVTENNVGAMLIRMAEQVPEQGQIYKLDVVDDVLDEQNNYVSKNSTLVFNLSEVNDKRIERIIVEVIRNDEIEEDKKD